jgi:membrane protease YdiL (CAAX protease family)
MIIPLKWFVFFLAPFTFLLRKIPLKEVFSFNNFKLSELKLGFVIGLSFFLIIIMAYYIFKGFINFDTIISDLAKKGITKELFLLNGLYICFGNSILEEFFFRGFIYLKGGKTLLSNLFSAFLFSFYHVAIILVWFDLWIMLLALAGLMIGGLFFNYLTSKSDNFLNSWLVHFFADLAIVSIGISLFYF